MDSMASKASKRSVLGDSGLKIVHSWILSKAFSSDSDEPNPDS